jgi:uncharacterized repeat protein (TIGR02543 family)
MQEKKIRFSFQAIMWFGMAAAAAIILAGCEDLLAANKTQTGALIVLPGDAQISAMWTDIADGEVFAGTGEEIPETSEGTVTLSEDGAYATITGLTNNTPYHVWVKGVNGEIIRTPEKVTPVAIPMAAGKYVSGNNVYELDGVHYTKYAKGGALSQNASISGPSLRAAAAQIGEIIYSGTIIFTDVVSERETILIIKIAIDNTNETTGVGNYFAIKITQNDGNYIVQGSKEIPVIEDGGITNKDSVINADNLDTADEFEMIGFVVNFNKNGGDTEPNPKKIVAGDGATLTLPIPPSRANYIFDGWFIGGVDGEAFTALTPVTEDITVYAKWTEAAEEPAVEEPAEEQLIRYTVTANGADGGNSTSITVTFDKPVSSLTASQIRVADNTGSVYMHTPVKTGDGTIWTYRIIEVYTAGIVTVTIIKDGVESDVKQLEVYKASGAEPITLEGSLVEFVLGGENPISQGTFDVSASSIAYNGETYVTTFTSMSTGGLLYSTDAVTWTFIANVFSLIGNTKVVWGDNKFVAVQKSGVATSPDGVNWTLEENTNLNSLLGNGIAPTFIAYEGPASGKKFFSGGASQKTFVSDDGVTWTETNSTLTSVATLGVAWGDNNQFVATGGKFAAFSTDGYTWTVMKKVGTVATTHKSIAFGKEKFVIVKSEGEIAYTYSTPDLITSLVWPKIAAGTGEGTTQVPKNKSINTIAFNGEYFLAAGSSGILIYSNDGITWQTINFVNGITVHCVFYDGNRFLLFGSTDGTGGTTNKVFIQKKQ